MHLVWRNLSVTRGRHQVLHGVSGEIQRNQFVGLLGPSGSGKTTLLHALVGLVPRRHLQGMVQLEGASPMTNAGDIAYLQQADAFLEALTVREHLEFQTRLFRRDLTNADRPSYIQRTLQLFRLSHCENTVIGSPYRRRGGISGGERRRLAIASQYMRRPKLLILDEATSGLDSHSTYRLLKALEEIRGRMTIILSIHQPTHAYLQAFDQILVLDRGHTVYRGPAAPLEMRAELERIGVTSLEDASTAYPTDDMMRLLAEDAETTARLRNAYAILPEIERATVAEEAEVEAESSTRVLAKRRPCIGFGSLVRRNWLDNWRNPQVVHARLGQSIVLSAIAIALFGGNVEHQSAVQDRTGLLFFLVTDAGFGSSFNALKTFARHLVVFRREYREGAYGLVNYFLSKVVADLPFQFIFPLVVFVPVFWITRPQSNIDTFLYSAATHSLVAQAGCSLGYFLTSVCGNMDVAVILNPTLLLPLMLTGGLYLKSASIPAGVRWLGDISFFRYGFENQMQLEWQNRTLTCDTDEVCLFHTGEEVLDYFAISNRDIGWNFLILGVIIVGLRLLALLALAWRTRHLR